MRYALVFYVPQLNLCECNEYREKHGKGIIDCKRFRKWPIEKVRAYWQIENIMIRLFTGTEQTILEDYHPNLPIQQSS